MIPEDQIEAQLKQLKAMGMTDDMIAIYRQQMEAAAKMAAQMDPAQMQQMQQMAANMANAFNFGGDDDGDDDDEAVELSYSGSGNLTPNQQWAVACGAILTARNDENQDEVELSSADKDEATTMLSEWWGVDNRAELIEMLESLYEGRHGALFAQVAEAYAQGKGAKKHLLATLPEDSDEDTALERLDNLRESHRQFVADGLLAENDPIPNMRIWDLGRLVNVARMGVTAGFINRDEALAFIEKVVPDTRATYGSWRELGIAYLLARCIWGGLDEDGEYMILKACLDALLNDPKSLWVVLPFKS